MTPVADDQFRVRPAVTADLPAVIDLLERVAAEGRWIGTEQVDREQRMTDFTTTLSSPDAAFFVADAAGEVIGDVYVGRRSHGVADLGMLVAEPWRGRGVGTALMGTAIDWARNAGAHKVALQVWTHNDAARSLYRKFGFEEEGLLRRHYRRRNGELWDAVVMGLLLDEPPAAGD